jgi:hypothetical protein
MSQRTSVVNISGDHEETIIQLAKHLGVEKIRRKVFSAIYGRGTRPKSKKQIIESAKIKLNGAAAQQVQNALDHLHKHHLIVRLDNDGSVRDGSRYLYQKDNTVRANRKQIVRLADNRKAADAMPTKRRPIVKGITSNQKTKSALKKRKHLNALYLAANPDPKNPLQVDMEVRRVQEAIRGSLFRDNISVQYKPAADLISLIDGLNDYNPQIVHFSGHGSEGGIVLDAGKPGKPSLKHLSFDSLVKALAATDAPPSVVVLNSCKSASAAKALLSAARIVITMRESVTDLAATAFATRFYAAIASGQSVAAAFAQGQVAVEYASIAESYAPQLMSASGVDPRKIILT